MKDIRQFCSCGKYTVFRKYSGMCSECVNLYAKYRRQVYSVIAASLKYETKSYIWNYLPYSVQELRKHLEKQFEPWMNWKNRGYYIKSDWKDNDYFTWKWQIDHIIPQHNFLFDSLENQNFTDCWALWNLRPISAKENIIKNIREII